MTKAIDDTKGKNKESLATYTVKHKFPITFILFMYLCLCLILFNVLNHTIVINTRQHPVTIIEMSGTDNANIRYFTD